MAVEGARPPDGAGCAVRRVPRTPVSFRTHREPRELTGSWVSLIEQLRERTTEPTPRPVLGAEQLTDMSAMLDRGRCLPRSSSGTAAALVRRELPRPDRRSVGDGSVASTSTSAGTLQPAAVAAMEAWAGTAGAAAPARGAPQLRPGGTTTSPRRRSTPPSRATGAFIAARKHPHLTRRSAAGQVDTRTPYSGDHTPRPRPPPPPSVVDSCIMVVPGTPAARLGEPGRR